MKVRQLKTLQAARKPPKPPITTTSMPKPKKWKVVSPSTVDQSKVRK